MSTIEGRRRSTICPKLSTVATVTSSPCYYHPSLCDIKDFETSNDELETKKKSSSAYQACLHHPADPPSQLLATLIRYHSQDLKISRR
jgi:hypothetical protein